MKQEIDKAVIEQLPLEKIDRVTFYKRDELTTDLICCDLKLGDQVWFFHEEAPGWNLLLSHLERLPGFKQDWYETVAQPPFLERKTLAYERA